MTHLNWEGLSNRYSYAEFRQLTNELLAKGQTTGADQSPAMIHYTELNVTRMNRLDKRSRLTEETLADLHKIERPLVWITITEAWCGDAAQCVPVIEKLAIATGGIQTHYILRDEHPAIMDAYLTNGGRSIPKLICLDEKGAEVFTWGPRPAVIQEVMNRLKADGVTEIATIVEAIQKAYNDDKQQGMYQEFVALLQELN